MNQKLITIACCLGVGSLGAQVPEVSNALFLSVDVSGSISNSEYVLQRAGYANAFADNTIKNLFDGTGLSLAVKYSEWASSAPGSNEVDWTIIDSPADSQAFSDVLAGLSRSNNIGFGTDLIDAFNYAGDDIAASLGTDFTVAADGEVILDVSGDGTGGSASAVSAARDGALADGFDVVNGIVIGSSTSLQSYFEANVQSANGFTIAADSFQDFEAAILEKLFVEISGGEIPEPTTIGLMGMAGIAAFVLIRRRRQTVPTNS